MSVNSYKRKIIISGDVVEVYDYDNPVIEGYMDTKKNSKGRQALASDEDKEINRDKVLNRARRDLRRLINANIGVYGLPGKFVTLTFKEDMEDLKKANYEFKKFIQRLETFHKRDIKYAAVPEIQKERFEKYGVKVWHYHVIFFNLPYMKSKDLSETWKNGFVKINRIDRCDNVGAYICKYMTKDNKELVGQKSYFTSRNLKKPVEIKDGDTAFADALPPLALTFETTFENEYNKIGYKQYNMKKVKIEQVI